MPVARWTPPAHTTTVGGRHIDATLLAVPCSGRDRQRTELRCLGGTHLRQRPGDPRRHAGRHAAAGRERRSIRVLLGHLLRPDPRGVVGAVGPRSRRRRAGLRHARAAVHAGRAPGDGTDLQVPGEGDDQVHRPEGTAVRAHESRGRRSQGAEWPEPARPERQRGRPRPQLRSRRAGRSIRAPATSSSSDEYGPSVYEFSRKGTLAARLRDAGQPRPEGAPAP